MKLLFITNGINGVGGLERVLSIKASYLVENYNYEVTILCLNGSHHTPFYTFSDKIRLISIAVGGNPISYLRAYYKGIREIVREVKPDVISVCDDGLKGFFIPKIVRTTIPLIYERHVSKEIELNTHVSKMGKNIIRIKWWLMTYLGSGFSKFVVLTEGNKKEWSSLRNLMVIPNPLSFCPNESSTLQNKKVLAVGKHGYQKGFDLLLAAWQKVIVKYPDWQLDIYGKSTSDLELEKLSIKLKIEKSVCFYPPELDIENKYLDASIYVMSSRFEGFGMVLIEAMACGVPCVSFDCPYGPSDIINHESDGLLVPKGDTIALASALSQLIANESTRMRMGIQAKENVKRYLPEVIMQQWDVLFKSLLK
jgi:glycosyltransferase involved in cell wall biosynthesis